MTREEFINQIAPLAQKAYKTLGKVHPSVCIAMACVECANGNAGSVKHNSLLGQKVGTGKTATKYWGGKFFTSKTKEEYTVGVHTTIKAAFRAYDSFEQCIFNYYELLNTNLYKKVSADANYETQMQQIKDCGYMTSSTEVNSVISIIKKYNLTKYDFNNQSKADSSVPNKDIPIDDYPITKIGDRNLWVVLLQQGLNRYGYKLNIDGIFGINTFNCVVAFQGSKNLKKDGIVGRKTWNALCS